MSPAGTPPLAARRRTCRRATLYLSFLSAHLEIQLFATVVATVVEQGRTSVGQDVDEVSPQVAPFTGVACARWDVLDPLDRLRFEMPSAHRPLLVAPREAAEARRRFLGPDVAFSRVRRGG